MLLRLNFLLRVIVSLSAAEIRGGWRSRYTSFGRLCREGRCMALFVTWVSVTAENCLPILRFRGWEG